MQFTDTSQAYRTEIVSWVWDFGDGFNSTAQHPAHRYRKAGIFVVVLSIRDAYGRRATASQRIFVDLITSWRLGFTPEQGIGFSKNTGDDWVRPFETVKPLLIYDDNDQPHLICLDRDDRKYFDMTTRDGPPEMGGYFKVWEDKCDILGANGAAVVPAMGIPEVRGTFEHYFIELARLHAYFRAIDEGDAGATGFDDKGYPSGLKFKIEVFCDGNAESADVEAAEIALPKHQITFPKKVPEANRLWVKLSANMGQHIVAGLQMYLIARDRPDGPDNLITTEGGYMAEVAEPVLWVGLYGVSTLLDFLTGTILHETASASTDPVGGSDAVTLLGPENLGSITLAGGSIFLWTYGTIALTIGGVAISLTTVGALTGWSLKYATGITASGAVVLTPTGAAKYYDPRAIAGTISSGFLAYYYKDCQNGGKVVLRK